MQLFTCFVCKKEALENIMCVAHVNESGKVIKQARTQYNDDSSRQDAITRLQEAFEMMRREIEIIRMR
jgi:hypothetical protein